MSWVLLVIQVYFINPNKNLYVDVYKWSINPSAANMMNLFTVVKVCPDPGMS